MFAIVSLLLGLGCGSASGPATMAPEAPPAPVEPWVMQVNGLRLGSSREQIVAAFGEPGPASDGTTSKLEYTSASVKFGAWQAVGDLHFVLKDKALSAVVLTTHPTLEPGSDMVSMMSAIGAAIFKGAATIPPVQLQWLSKPAWRYRSPLQAVLADGGAAPTIYLEDGGLTWAQLAQDDGKLVLVAMTTNVADMAQQLLVQTYSVVPQAPHVGDPLDVGGARMVINEIVPTKQVGMQAMPQKATEGASWVVVRYSVENTGNDTTLGVPGNDMFLRDAAGRNFRASGDGTTGVAMAENLDLIVTQLQPGIVKPLVQVFEVPDSVLGNLTLVVPHGNPLTGQQYELALDLD